MANFQLKEFLLEASRRGVSDVYCIPGTAMNVIEHGEHYQAGERLMPDDTDRIIKEAYAIAKREDNERVFREGDDNFSFTLPGVSRFRISMFRQRNSYGCFIRMIPFNIPPAQELNIPPEVLNASAIEEGLILVAGISGSGKTTTMASILQKINKTESGKLLITLEQPLEYLHRHEKCIVVQREIKTDTKDYLTGLDAALNQHPGVVLLSDMPTPEVVQKTLQIAQSGRMVMTALPGNSSADAISCMVDLFRPEDKKTIASQLGNVLKLIIYQRMVPTADQKGIIPVFETVYMNDILKKQLKELDMDGFFQAVSNAKTDGIVPFDRSLILLYRQQKITRETAERYAMNKAAVHRQIY